MQIISKIIEVMTQSSAGACAIVEILRSELGSNNTVIIVVGTKGNASPHGNNQQIIQTPGENGSIYLEYYA